MTQYLRCISNIRSRILSIHYQYERFGGRRYSISEPISIIEHSVQTANYMRKKLSTNNNAIVSALLHDYGHIAVKSPIDPKYGVDDRHEWIGLQYLRNIGFPKDVYMPVGLHVRAKRYNVSKNPDYFDSLSKGSKLSLQLQGGMMTNLEIEKFQKNKWFTDAIMLRIADDKGKDESLASNSSILEFSDELEEVLSREKYLPFNKDEK